MKIFGHPVHTMLVHFPIAFWSLATIFDALALYGVADAWRASAFLTGLGLFIGLAAMLPGLVDLARLGEAAHKTGLTHMALMSAAWGFYLASLVFHVDQGAITATPSPIAFALDMIGFLCLAIGGFYGGELVYRYGAGQKE
ncbi:MAG: DUF2231 domain-containing protein [Hyphomicrobiaceae bacterium]|nr:DUF2231 domain-containing protein [Hyphomicrobiaceae bacterium]